VVPHPVASESATEFFYNAVAHFAKSLAYRSVAHESLRDDERLAATICGYYSLFHLALTVMYLLPEKMAGIKGRGNRELLSELVSHRKGGKKDPRKEIPHTSAVKFIEARVRDGLPARVPKLFADAQRLREFVNYGPDITIDGEVPIFASSMGKCVEADKLIGDLDDAIVATVMWLHSAGAQAEMFLSKNLLNSCEEFFQGTSKFYPRWCSHRAIDSARLFLRSIATQARGSPPAPNTPVS
jgi:hypothetical protein